jgi:protein-S-isoprenylcysteine O-methyltransferase Ste14
MVTVVIPALILWSTGVETSVLSAIFGVLLIAAGLALAVWTWTLFAREGHGTLAPWEATRRLVVRGPYKYVRNPMITGVALIFGGEAVLFQSWPLVILLVLFIAVNAIYFQLVEEPGLRHRFGAEYDDYRARVPRWLPRLRP